MTPTHDRDERTPRRKGRIVLAPEAAGRLPGGPPRTEDQKLLRRTERPAFLDSDPWRALRILAEFVEGFDALAAIAAERLGAVRAPRAVVDAFAAHPRAEVVEQLRLALENPMPKVRRFALRVLFALFGEGAADQFVTSLDDDDVEVKRLAIKILGKLRDKRVIEPLVALLQKEGGEYVEDAVWNTLKVLTDLREFEQLRARVAKERAGARPSVRKVRSERDLSPDWWREQD